MGIEKGIMGGKKMPRVSCCAICRQLRRVARCVSPDIYNFLSLASSTSSSIQGSLSCYEASKNRKLSEKLVKFAYVYESAII